MIKNVDRLYFLCYFNYGRFARTEEREVKKWQQVKQWELSNSCPRCNTHSRRSNGRIITLTKEQAKNGSIFTGERTTTAKNMISKSALPATVYRQCMTMCGKNAKGGFYDGQSKRNNRAQRQIKKKKRSPEI